MEVRSLKLDVGNIEKINGKRKEKEMIHKCATEYSCKGITLIALVITIIVLLILAGVTLNLTIGENGIFTVAKRAAIEQKKQTYFEEIKLEIFEEQTKRVIEPTTELFIVSIERRIKTKAWVKDVLMCDESGIEKAPEASTMLIVETIEGYEIRIKVNNEEETAEIIEEYFEKVGKKLTVRYDGNGGTGEVASQEVRKNFSIILPKNGFTKAGYVFVGWNTDKDNKENNAMPSGSEYKNIEENTTLYAIWSVDIVTIQFESNGGQGTITDITVQRGSTVETLPENSYTKEGYTFIGWKDQDQNEYLDKAKIENISKDITLTAQWIKNPKVTAKTTDYSNLVRKTNITIPSLFNIDWGEDGEGTIKYEVTGTLLYKTTNYSSTTITNLSELELGTYIVKCTVTSPEAKVSQNAQKSITINRLANTQVKNKNNENEVGYAIYSEYDLAYFRDLVNNDTTSVSNINGGLMNNIQLTNVSSSENGGWAPIGYWIGQNDQDNIPLGKYYGGIFDGNNHTITLIELSDDTTYQSMGLFGMISGYIHNLTVDGTLTSNTPITGCMIGALIGGEIYKCTNSCAITSGTTLLGGVIGYASNATIESCYNEGEINGGGEAGGIVGHIENDTNIRRCSNSAKIYNALYSSGGIAGVCLRRNKQ